MLSSAKGVILAKEIKVEVSYVGLLGRYRFPGEKELLAHLTNTIYPFVISPPLFILLGHKFPKRGAASLQL
jgi:hypothetical protein